MQFLLLMRLLKYLFSIFYPNSCVCCNRLISENKTLICLECRANLPITNFCFEEQNLVEKAFYGRIPLVSATALLFFYKKGVTQNLIHNLKYKNKQEIGTFLGNWLSKNMLESNRFSNVTCVVPVPLHKTKKRKRGYNQLTKFGKAIAKNLNIPFIDNVLVRKEKGNSQTNKVRFERWKNVENLFFVNQTKTLENQHILLIDDVITTGATLEACYTALCKAKNSKISIACMAYTK